MRRFHFIYIYDSDNCSLNRSDKRKIKAAEMRFLRPMAGYAKKRSTGIFNINDKLTEYKISTEG